jgi:hypothetical protein
MYAHPIIRLAAELRTTHPDSHALPSLVHGMLVRFRYGVYNLRQVEQLFPAGNEHPVVQLRVPKPAADLAERVAALPVPLDSLSSTNPFGNDGSWTAMGADETARLQAWMHAQQRSLPLREVRRACHVSVI